MIIALDAMGGDNAPDVVLEGAAMVLRSMPFVRFRLFGNESVILPKLESLPQLKAACELFHTDVSISAHEKPSVALRQGAKSSMRLAINDVAEGNAHSVVSGGNTGALMAMSKFVLRSLPGVSRPAITSTLPTLKRSVVMLDMGANIECSAQNLLEFAVMGEAFCRAVLGYEAPRIGILNVGAEEAKGHDYLREAAEKIRQSPLGAQFCGFVEGTDIAAGSVDVVVTDGFTGNVALKVMEGTARLYAAELKKSLNASLIGRLGALLALPSLRKLKRHLNPSLRNGGMFLGLNGIAIKSHGGADAEGFANAIRVAINIAEKGLNQTITAELLAWASPPVVNTPTPTPIIAPAHPPLVLS
jgi:glycerol-3-phosphate acyltransferase PlsX